MMVHTGAAIPLGTWEDDGGRTAPTARAEEEQLDWAGFLTRFYPDARKHDYASLAAYVEYGKTFASEIRREGRSTARERSRP